MRHRRPGERLPSDYFVIFGAAVRPDGSPSGTLERRTLGALALGRSSTSPIYLATGGKGRHGPPEAEVMKTLLVRIGVPETRVLVEPCATNTLESILYSTRILAERDDPEVDSPSSQRREAVDEVVRVLVVLPAVVPQQFETPGARPGRTEDLRFQPHRDHRAAIGQPVDDGPASQPGTDD